MCIQCKKRLCSSSKMVQMKVLLWVYVLAVTINAETNISKIVQASLSVVDASNSTETNNTKELLRKQDDGQRITQPMIENRSANKQTSLTNSSEYNQEKMDKKFGDFRPSPQINMYYEHNRFPVVPALPEAKYFPGSVIDEKPTRFETRPWSDKPTILTLPSMTTNQPWSSNIKFPTTQNSFETIKDHPYQYPRNSYYPETTTRSLYSYVLPGTHPAETVTKHAYSYPTDYDTSTISSSINHQQSLSKFGGLANSLQDITSKFGDIFNHKGSLFGSKPTAIEVTSPGIPVVHKTPFEYQHSMMPHHGSMKSPWKKVIAFLTAAIPIGLLLSALTPQIINISPLNNTYPRGRKEDEFINSLNYISKLSKAGCEERIICELLLGAGSPKNAEKHVENLFNIFTEQEKDVLHQITELKQILEAVKAGNCNLLYCNAIKIEEPTQNETDVKP